MSVYCFDVHFWVLLGVSRDTIHGQTQGTLSSFVASVTLRSSGDGAAMGGPFRQPGKVKHGEAPVRKKAALH